MEGTRTSFDSVGARAHPIVHGELRGAENQKTEPPGLGFSWEMGNKGGREWRGVQWRGLERVLMLLVHAVIRSYAGSRVVQKIRKPSHRGSVFPGRWVTKAGEG